jgi:hypothetical protein
MRFSNAFPAARAGVATLLLALTLGGCGRDSTGPRDSSLDQALSLELLDYLFDLAWAFIPAADFSALADRNAPAGPSAAPLSRAAAVLLAGDTFTFDQTASCPRGGNVRVQGTIVDNTNAQGTGAVSLQFTQTPNACRVDTEQNGVFEMNGNPHLGFSMSANFVDDEPAEEFLTAQYTGGFRWSGGGRSGSCSLDLTFRIGWLTEVVTVTGSLCGNTVSFGS